MHKCWLCGYSLPCGLWHKQSDKQKWAFEQASRCRQSSSQTSMGQTWLESKPRRVFYLSAPEPNKQLFPRAASHCRMCQYQCSLNNQTADRWRTLETLLRRFGLLHTAGGALGCSSSFLIEPFLIFFPLLHAHCKQTNKQTSTQTFTD